VPIGQAALRPVSTRPLSLPLWVLARVGCTVYEIKLGTVDIAEADSEWVARPYMNTAKKRAIL